MAILFFGSNNSLNNVIISTLLDAGLGKITWMVTSSEIERLPKLAEVEVVDLSKFESFAEAIGEKDKKTYSFNRIVFAKGIGGVRPIKMNSKPFVEEMFNENVFSFFEFIRALLKEKRILSGASIVALSSVSSIKGLKSKSVYSASKAALDAAVRGMAVELAPKKVRINSIQKGWVDVDMELPFIKDNITLSGGSDFSEQPLGAIPAEELGRLTRFLLSDEVTSMTGVNLVLDGGYTL